MAEGEQDANQGADSSAAPLPENDQSNATPGSAESSAGNDSVEKGKENLPFHEHPRFKELIGEKNQLRAEVESLRSQVASTLQKREEIDPAEKQFQRFKEAGVDEKTARLLAESQVESARDVADQRLAPIEANAIQAEINRNVNEFASRHKDYDEVRPLMEKLYMSLPEKDKGALASSSRGFEWLYNTVKSDSIEDQVKKAYEKGKAEGYQNKKGKESFAPTSGGTTKGITDYANLSEEQIADMPMKEYNEHRMEIIKSHARQAR